MHASQDMRWTQREILVAATIGVVFGVVYLAVVQL